MKNKKGLTVIELVVVMTVFAILFGIITINLKSAARSASLNSSITTLISDIKSQQMKAVSKDTSGGTTSDSFGIYFDSSSYTLFRGQAYNPTEPSNQVIDLDSSLEFQTINLPSSSIVFAIKSGEIVGFNESQNSLTLKDVPNQESKTITLNKLGVVTSLY